MENINEINTVQDLLKANEEDSPAEKICKKIFELDPTIGFAISKNIIAALADWHANTAKDKFESKEDTALLWARDEAILTQALRLLEDVEL